jgi:predicted transcriptional regulator of viral defense system
MKFMRELTSHFESKPAFTSREVRTFLLNRGASAGYHKLLIHNLQESRRIFRISRGAYTFHEEVQLVGFGFQPFYYGLQDALSLRGLWEQETNPVILTPKRVRNGLRQFEGRNYLIRRIDRKMFFGFTFVSYYDFSIPVSDVEKTLIDFFYYRVKIPAEAQQSIAQKIDKARLRSYLKEVPDSLSRRVIQFLRSDIQNES